jgi:SulP family sulfate permease
MYSLPEVKTNLLSRAKDMVEVNQHEDPHYHIADNKLG